jgi:hypothetical protein
MDRAPRGYLDAKKLAEPVNRSAGFGWRAKPEDERAIKWLPDAKRLTAKPTQASKKWWAVQDLNL